MRILQRQSSRSRSGASPAGVGQTPRHSTSSASSRGPPEVVQLRPQHSVFQRITLPTVSDPESRVRHVEDQLGINSRRIAMEAQQGHQVGQLRVRQAELTAMLGRLTHQINLERQHGPRVRFLSIFSHFIVFRCPSFKWTSPRLMCPTMRRR